MAKKDNTLLWVVGLAGAGYLFYEYQKKQAAAAQNATSTAITQGSSSTGQLSDAKPVVMLPPSSQLNTNQPINAASASSAPSTVVLDTTNLVPAAFNNDGEPVLLAGQSLALNPGGVPVLNNEGVPMVFAAPAPLTNKNARLTGLDYDDTEVL